MSHVKCLLIKMLLISHVNMISGFCHEVDENCILLGYYAPCSGNFLPTFQDSPSTPEDGTDGLSRNVGKKLPLLNV